MNTWQMHATGFWIGFAFGTIGLVAISLLRLMFPFVEIITEPLLWPSRMLARLFTDDSASTSMVLFLYSLTGTFYGLCGTAVQEMQRRARLHRVRV